MRAHPGPTPTSRRIRVAVAGLALALGLSACTAGLPVAPDPRAGLPVSPPDDPEVDVYLQPPQSDAEPAGIVRGFLRANVGFADESDVPRSFLTDALARTWVPTQNIVVYDSGPSVELAEGDEVTMRVPVAGRIDAQGRLTEVPEGETVSATFGLEEVDGQWRISSFPEDFGLWLSRSDLEDRLRPTTLYYLAPRGDYFVPETRWFPRDDGRATAVARALTASPSAYLQGAVRQSFGADLALTGSSVRIDPSNQVATVALESSGLEDGTPLATDVVSQLTRTLLALPGISGIDVQVSGQSLRLPDANPPYRSSTPLPYTDPEREGPVPGLSMALLRVGERFVPVTPSVYDLRDLSEGRVGDLELPRLSLSYTGVAATDDLSDFAAVSVDRSRVWHWHDGRSETNTGIGEALTAPSVDRFGSFWIGGTDSSGAPRVWVMAGGDSGSLARPLEVPWLTEEDRINDLSVSPDGTRVVLVTGTAERPRTRLLLAGILRDEDGRATALAEPERIAQSLTEMASARWSGNNELYLVGRRAADTHMRGFALPLGQWLTPLGGLDGIIDLIPAPYGQSSVPVAVTQDGRLHTREGSQGWFEARNGDELVIPGG